jgi:hypothetical protein
MGRGSDEEKGMRKAKKEREVALRDIVRRI